MVLLYELPSNSYALPLTKAQAVAQETLLVWCSLASRLGLWALKAELEDLCFAVLQVKEAISSSWNMKFILLLIILPVYDSFILRVGFKFMESERAYYRNISNNIRFW